MVNVNSRCSICNCVSSEEIETNPGEFDPSSNYFVPDPSNDLFDICLSCLEEIQEVEDEWNLLEEPEDELVYEYDEEFRSYDFKP